MVLRKSAAAPAARGPHPWRPAAGLGLLLMAAFWVRWLGIGWGLPTADRYYPYHPDEAVLAGVAARVNPLWGEWRTGFYNYGSLTIYLSRLAFDFTGALAGGGTVPQPRPFSGWVQDFSRLIFTGRVLSVLLGVATVALVFCLGRALGGAGLAWAAAACLAAMPVHVLHGRYMTVDVPATFFQTAAMLAGVTAMRGGWRPAHVLLCGVLTGWAAGTKYNGGIVLLPVLAALWLDGALPARERVSRTLLLSVAGAAGFLMATPGCVLEPARFWADLEYEIIRNREGQGLVFRGTPPGLLYHLAITLPLGLGVPMVALSLTGPALLRGRGRAWVIPLLFALIYGTVLCFAERKFTRYLAPLAPVLALTAGHALLRIRARAPGPGLAAAVLAIGSAGWSSVAHGLEMDRPDPRDRMLRRVESLAGGSTVALASDPWFYTPPVHPTAGCVKASQAFGGPPIWALPGLSLSRFRSGAVTYLIPGSLPPAGALDPGSWGPEAPEWVLVSDYEYEDHRRLAATAPGFQSDMTRLLKRLDTDYSLAVEEGPSRLLRAVWWPRSEAPHDWRYPTPTLRLYRRNRRS